MTTEKMSNKKAQLDRNREAVTKCRNKAFEELDRVKDFEQKFHEEKIVLEIAKKQYEEIEEKNNRLMNYVTTHECILSSKSRISLCSALWTPTSFVIPVQPVFHPPPANPQGRKPHANPKPNTLAVRRTTEKKKKAKETGMQFKKLCSWQGPILEALQDRVAKSEDQNRAIMKYIRSHKCILSTKDRLDFCNIFGTSSALQPEEVPCDPHQSHSINAHLSSEPEASPTMDLEDDRPSAFVPMSQQPDSSIQFLQSSQPLVIPEYTPLTGFFISNCFWKYYGTGVPVLSADAVKQAGLPDCSPVNLLISERSLNSALGIKDDISCTECGWKFEKRTIQLSTTDQPWKCKNCAEFWRVPRWGGVFMMDGVVYKLENTCSVDSFLAILVGQHKKNPLLINSIGTSLYENCLKNLLVAPDIDIAKIELVVQCYRCRLNRHQRSFNLFGAESFNLEDLTKRASRIEYRTSCTKCKGEKANTKFQYDGVQNSRELEEINLSWLDFIYGIIFPTPKCKKHVGAINRRCGGETQIRHLEMKGWMIPINLSLLKLHPQTVEEFPNAINIGNERFELGGISIHRSGATTSADHFLSLVPHRSKWVLYDGMQEGTPNKYIRPDEIGRNFTVSTLYYFISK